MSSLNKGELSSAQRAAAEAAYAERVAAKGDFTKSDLPEGKAYRFLQDSQFMTTEDLETLLPQAWSDFYKKLELSNLTFGAVLFQIKEVLKMATKTQEQLLRQSGLGNVEAAILEAFKQIPAEEMTQVINPITKKEYNDNLRVLTLRWIKTMYPDSVIAQNISKEEVASLPLTKYIA